MTMYNYFMNSKEIKSYNLPASHHPVQVIDAKPYSILFFLLVIGAALSLYSGLMYGFALLILGAMVFVMLPRRILLEFCDDYMVMYNRPSNNECMMVYYCDIERWKYQKGIYYDELVIDLVDGSHETIEAFSKSTFEFALEQHVPDKKIKL